MREKLNFFLQKLRTLPECRNDEYYRFADYIELKCLASLDGSYSHKEFIDDARQRTDDLGEGDFEGNQNEKNLEKAEKNDKWESRADDSFRIIESRIIQFGDLYPFYLTDNKKALKLKETLNDEKMYIFLLLCSDLKYTIKFKKELTSSFESISLGSMKKLFPNGDIHLFGSSNTEDGEVEWASAKLWDKLVWLGGFLNEKLNITEEELLPYDKGDRGIDIVGKIPVGDGLTNMPILFAQCACSPKDWVTKQHTISYSAWKQLITLSTDPNYLMFIPQSYRDSKGDWHDKTKIHSTVLFDRQRILSNFRDNDSFKKYTAFPVVENILTLKESTF
jgi:hypothetical protein